MDNKALEDLGSLTQSYYLNPSQPLLNLPIFSEDYVDDGLDALMLLETLKSHRSLSDPRAPFSSNEATGSLPLDIMDWIYRWSNYETRQLFPQLLPYFYRLYPTNTAYLNYLRLRVAYLSFLRRSVLQELPLANIIGEFEYLRQVESPRSSKLWIGEKNGRMTASFFVLGSFGHHLKSWLLDPSICFTLDLNVLKLTTMFFVELLHNIWQHMPASSSPKGSRIKPCLYLKQLLQSSLKPKIMMLFADAKQFENLWNHKRKAIFWKGFKKNIDSEKRLLDFMGSKFPYMLNDQGFSLRDIDDFLNLFTVEELVLSLS